MPNLTRKTWRRGDRRWLGSLHALEDAISVRPDSALFTAALFPDGYVPSGTPLGRVTATDKVGPYTGDATDEVQTVTITGTPTGGTFTLTYSGQTTAAIAYNATAATVQAALEALSNIAVGDVTVTGGPGPGTAFTVTFGGDLENTNVAQLTSTPSLTGGSTPSVTHATTTAGGADASADGREVLVGFLADDREIPADGGWPAVWHGLINVDHLPVVFAKTGHNTTGQFTFDSMGA